MSFYLCKSPDILSVLPIYLVAFTIVQCDVLGPVLGPLVYACAFWPATEHDSICKMDFNDSKQLKEGEREGLLQSIIDHPSIGWIVEEITAVDISQDMMRVHPISLNTVSYDAVARMLKRIVTTDLDNPPQITDVFVDTVGDPGKHQIGKTQLFSSAPFMTKPRVQPIP